MGDLWQHLDDTERRLERLEYLLLMQCEREARQYNPETGKHKLGEYHRQQIDKLKRQVHDNWKDDPFDS